MPPCKKVRFLSYGKEIALAVGIKFLLLGGLWWCFFSGTKQPVDETIIADKLFGEHTSTAIVSKQQSRAY